MIIGIPKEIMPGENRVAATPATVAKFLGLGHEVMVEQNAGRGAYHKDAAYTEAGAMISADVRSIFSRADIILKVKEPIFNTDLGAHEIDMIREGAALIAFLHPAAPGNHAMVEKLRDKNITAFTMDGIPRISRAQRMDALTSMSTITGYKAVMIAASHLPVLLPMVGTAIGPLKPANVLIIGAGVVGLQAIATARRLGAIVSVVDIQDKAREAALSLGAKISGFEVPDEIAREKDGYAKALPDAWLQKERDGIFPLLKETDAVILSALVPGEVAPLLITRDMVVGMKPGAVIVDVSIDQGGNCELTEGGKIIEVDGIHIIGTKNIPGMVPVSSTWMFALNIYNLLSSIVTDGRIVLKEDDEIIASALVTRDGKIIHQGALEAMGSGKDNK